MLVIFPPAVKWGKTCGKLRKKLNRPGSSNTGTGYNNHR